MGAFRVVFAVRLLRELAMTTEILGLSVLVYAHTGSPLLIAVAFAIGMFPQIVGGCAVHVDSRSAAPRAVLTVSLLIRAVPGAVIGLLALPVWAMLVLVGVIACLDPVGGGSGWTAAQDFGRRSVLRRRALLDPPDLAFDSPTAPSGPAQGWCQRASEPDGG